MLFYARSHWKVDSTYWFFCSVPDVPDLLEPLETAITGEFIPAIIRQSISE